MAAPASSRLPTLTAAEILQTLEDAALTTGIEALDKELHGGLEQGRVTEVWGPTGVGKTALGLTITGKALASPASVLWASCAAPLSSGRVKSTMDDEHLERLTYMHIPTLSHLLALIKHSENDTVFLNTSLFVLDDLNTLVDFDYPRQTAFAMSSEGEARKWQAGRRNMILAAVVTALNKLANIHRMAVLVLNGCATSNRTHTGYGAVLVSAIGGIEWDSGTWNRLALFQDFNGRFIALRKIEGKVADTSTSLTVKYGISSSGLVLDHSAVVTSSAQPVQDTDTVRKRVFQEIADSEDEQQYDWSDLEDSDLPDTELPVKD